MKKITLLVFSLLLSSFACMAQMPTGNLSIFSEDGSKFFLELNGQRYNTVAQTNVRIEELPNPYYSCNIVFADAKKPMISQKTIMIADPDGIMQDVTYRIKKDKKGKRSLKFYSFVPAQQNMVRPKGCAVYRYGTPNDMIMNSDGTLYTQQVTVQQTTTTTDGYGGINMNVGGIGMSVTVPADNITTTTTTTTTTTSGNGNGYQQNNGGYNNNNGSYNNGNNNNGNSNNGYNNNNGGYNNGNNNNNNNNSNNGGCRNAMSTTDFQDAINTIKSSNFDDTRLSTAKEVLASNCVSTNQVITLVKLMTFEENKLELAMYAYGYCMERNNYYKVVNAFTFESSKTELNDYIKEQR